MNNRDLTATERFMKLGGLCCQKYVSQKDILKYDYTDGMCYPKVDEVDWDEVVDAFGGMVRCIEHKHKRYIGRKRTK